MPELRAFFRLHGFMPIEEGALTRWRSGRSEVLALLPHESMQLPFFISCLTINVN